MPRTVIYALFTLLLLLSLGGCLSAPSEIQDEFSAPDGIRTNHYRPGQEPGARGTAEDDSEG